jgi:gentisate 1,2-dioxygenase
MFFERHPQKLEQNVVSVDEAPIAFRWEATREALEHAAPPANGMAQREIELGAPALKTTAIHVQRMAAGFVSPRYRTTANAIFTVLEGRGTTRCGDTEMHWERGDMIAMPAWRSYQHKVDGDAHLVRVSDEPVMRALGLLRDEVVGAA